MRLVTMRLDQRSVKKRYVNERQKITFLCVNNGPVTTHTTHCKHTLLCKVINFGLTRIDERTYYVSAAILLCKVNLSLGRKQNLSRER